MLTSLPMAPFRLLLVVLAGLWLASTAGAQDRRLRTSPGLILDTGARHAACDVLRFTADGKQLFAAGDDKVVRFWDVGANNFPEHRSVSLRWPIYREQRGCIFAVALSPDKEQKYVAVGGFGVKNSLITILDRTAPGKVIQTMTDVGTSNQAVWSIAFSPAGDQVIFGIDNGGIYAWNFKAGPGPPTELARPVPGAVNRIRMLSFLSEDKEETRFLAVTRHGDVLQYDLAKPGAAPVRKGDFRRKGLDFSVFRATISPDRKWIVAASEYTGSTKINKEVAARIMEGIQSVQLLDLDTGSVSILSVPQAPAGAGRQLKPTTVAFDSAGKHLAIGATVIPVISKIDDSTFFRELDGVVQVFAFTPPEKAKLVPLAVCRLGYRVEAIAFRPGDRSQLATGGGNNHEIRLWNIENTAAPLDTIQSPGSCLWSVGLSADQKYLGFRDKRKEEPTHPNDWGAGPWRVLDLEAKPRRLLDAPPTFKPVVPRNAANGWEVRCSNPTVWEVLDPDGNTFLLDNELGRYDLSVNALPRCYTFLEGVKDRSGREKPLRLAVGHSWGVSVYDCVPGSLRLSRLLVGHEGEVMAVAPSADGRVLVTASRDQTISGWSLEDWPSHPELGASFVPREGKLLVKKIDPGSPAWEMGMVEGDEIVLFNPDDVFAYNTTGKTLQALGIGMAGEGSKSVTRAMALLQKVQPNQELIFAIDRFKTTTKDGKVNYRLQKTTLRQRPLWRLFPTRKEEGNEFVIWRWRDFYYDTRSARADSFVGWHVNTGNYGLDGPALFYPLERFRGTRSGGGSVVGYYRPEKVWDTILDTLAKPDKVLFPDIEPPEIRIVADKKIIKDADLSLTISVTPRTPDNPQQQVALVSVWLDDFRSPIELKPDAAGNIPPTIKTIDRKLLRPGINRIRVVAYNEAGGRGEQTVEVTYDAPAPTRINLYGLCVGLNDFSRTRGTFFGNLGCCENDAEAIHKLLEKQKGGIYKEVEVTLFKDRQVKAPAVLEHLNALTKKGTLSRNDWFVLYLSGHGDDVDAKGARGPEHFYYVCSDTNTANDKTKLLGEDLAQALAELKCHKLIILDTCHSGSIGTDPVRCLLPDNVPFMIFSACKPDQESLEVPGGKYGMFTQALLEFAGAHPGPVAVRGREVQASEAASYIRRRLPTLLTGAGMPIFKQTPTFYPDPLPPTLLLRRP